MDGAPVTVMSNSGSGNQGISSMLPVLTFAQRQGRDEETTTRAVMMSSLLVVYVKQQLGRLSCLCGYGRLGYRDGLCSDLPPRRDEGAVHRCRQEYDR